MFREASAGYGMNLRMPSFREASTQKGNGDNPNPFQKKSSLFGAPLVNAW